MGQRISYLGQPISGVNAPIYQQLTSGAWFLLGLGQYVVELGRQAAIQFYNANNGTWNNLYAQPGTYSVLSDGVNYRVINLSGTISGASVTNKGSNYVQASTTCAFAAPVSGITATGVAIVGGDLTIAITAGGAGYTNPVVYIDPPWVNGQNPVGALPAYATVGLTLGAISSVTLGFSGAGYVGVPNVYVADPTGTGAILTASIGVTNAAKINGILMTNIGSGYDGTHIPAVTIGGAGASAAATAIGNFAVQSVTVSSGGTGFSTSEPIILTDGGVIAAALNGETLPFRPMEGAGLLTAGAISSVFVENEGNGIQSVPLVGAINTGAIATGAPTLVPVVGGVNTYVRFWQAA